MPIMGTQFAKKAKDAIIVKKNSIYAKAALKQQESQKKNLPVSEVKVETPVFNKPVTEDINENNSKKKKNNSEESK